jgi:hypothetical protein
MKTRRRLEITAFRRRTTIVLRDQAQGSNEPLPPGDPAPHSPSDLEPAKQPDAVVTSRPTFQYRRNDHESKD